MLLHICTFTFYNCPIVTIKRCHVNTHLRTWSILHGLFPLVWFCGRDITVLIAVISYILLDIKNEIAAKNDHKTKA